jgi:uncharacterized protein DUF5670
MEVKDAVDDFCHPLGVVVSRRDFVVHPGGFIHILLVIALVVLLIQLITGRRAV